MESVEILQEQAESEVTNGMEKLAKDFSEILSRTLNLGVSIGKAFEKKDVILACELYKKYKGKPDLVFKEEFKMMKDYIEHKEKQFDDWLFDYCFENIVKEGV